MLLCFRHDRFSDDLQQIQLSAIAEMRRFRHALDTGDIDLELMLQIAQDRRRDTAENLHLITEMLAELPDAERLEFEAIFGRVVETVTLGYAQALHRWIQMQQSRSTPRGAS
jgi:hypothetical protein